MQHKQKSMTGQQSDKKFRFTVITMAVVAITLSICAILFFQQGPTMNSVDPSVFGDPLLLPGEGEFMRNLRQITNGGENAEAYYNWNFDKLIFQSTRPGITECDQIFTMNIDGSDTIMRSTGLGRTTCSYYFPNNQDILYGSTHLHFNGSCPPDPDMSKGYVWKLYPEFDIFKSVLTEDGAVITQQMTDSPGYDAEATISVAANKIVFTSMRDGDPELYSMNFDGSEQTRLTFENGYDGGAFYSWDGTKIVFRASRPDLATAKDQQDYFDLVQENLVRPTTLELMVMDADGSNMRQITNLDCASFGPFYHPDNEHIIFSSNYNQTDGRNFELWIIKDDGTNLRRVTNNDSFDGFPMFNEDGTQLTFASNRNNANFGDTNVFTADWVFIDDE